MSHFGLKRGANVYTNMSTNVLAVFLRKCGDLQIATCHTFVHWLARGQRPHPDGGQRRRRTPHSPLVDMHTLAT